MIYNQEDIYNILYKIVCLIDIKDDYTKSHSINVAKYAVLLGEQLKLDKEDLKKLEIGAILHDIGKIGIPDNILLKKSRLTEEEYELIKKHVIMGTMLLPNKGFDEIKEIVHSHHERIDGRGYPDGLKGSEIPYLARIISVVDAFDAMTTKRGYNVPMSVEEAVEELLKVSKKNINDYENIQQLDPYIVRAFVKVIKENPNILETQELKDLYNNESIQKNNMVIKK